MTSSVPANVIFEYTGDGVTAAFSFPVKFIENADVEVYVDDVLKSITTQYSLTGAGGPSGGTVTFTAGYIPASGEAIVLRRATAPKQTVDLTDSGRTPGDTLEAQLDRLAMASQDLKARLTEIEELAEGPPGDDGVDGKFSGTEVIKVGAYQVVAADVGKTIILNKGTADTLTFEAAATLGATFMAIVKNIGVGTWTLDPAETIDGLATIDLAQGESCVVMSNGTALRTAFRGETKQAITAGLTALIAAWTAASASGPSTLDLYEDTDNGSNRIRLSAPSSVGSDKTISLPDVAGTVVLGSTGSTDNRVLRADGTGTATLQNSPVTINDSGNISGLGTVDSGAITSSGLLDISGGSAGQIKFPASQNASSNANTLDDYEEGTITPQFSSSGATFSYAIQSGQYTKIGNRVMYEIDLALNGSGNTLTANALSITGLPFTVGSLASIFEFHFVAVTSSFVALMGLAAAGGTSIAVYGNTAANTTTPTQNSNAALHTTNGSRLRGSSHYAV